MVKADNIGSILQNFGISVVAAAFSVVLIFAMRRSECSCPLNAMPAKPDCIHVRRRLGRKNACQSAFVTERAEVEEFATFHGFD